MRHQDKKQLVGAGTVAVIELKQLLSFRQRLSIDKRRHQVYKTDLYPCLVSSVRKVFGSYSARSIRRIDAMIAAAGEMIKEVITRDPLMHRQYILLLSVERVGPVLAAYLIAATERFSRMNTARQLACHAGVAPHKHTSGSSLQGRARVSHQADKTLKSLLHMAAIGICQSDSELGDYYRRKVAEGKNPMAVLNAVRNKLVHRVCKVVARNTPYEVRQAAQA
jgi:transposase